MAEILPMIKGAAATVRDGYTNMIARLGYGQENQSSASLYQFDFLTRNRMLVEAMYRTGWLARMAVDCVAEDMTRDGIEFKGDMDPKAIKQLQVGLSQELLVWPALTDTIKWSRLYGGSIAMMMIDGQDPSTPLNVKTIGRGQLKGLLALDRWMLQPSMGDIITENSPYIGLPRFYETVVSAPGIPRVKVHFSRVIRLEGMRLPYYQRMTENLWGQSVYEPLHDRLLAFDSTTLGAAQLAYKAHIRTLRIKGFRQIVATGGDQLEGVLKSIAFMRLTQSNEGISVFDTNDEFETHTYTFAGLSDLLIQMGQQVSGSLQIPMVRLFGQSPAGMNSTGEGDLRTYQDNVARERKAKLHAPMTTFLNVASMSILGVPLSDDTTWEFIHPYSLNEKEKSEVANNLSTAIVGAFNAGIVTRKAALLELKQSADATGVWSNISEEDIKDAESDPPPSELANQAMEMNTEEGDDNPDNGGAKQKPSEPGA